MRLYVVFFLLFSFCLSAQEIPKMAPMQAVQIKEDKLIATISSDNWSGFPDSLESKPFLSRGFSFLLMNEKMNKKGNFGIGAGLGFTSQNVHTNAFIAEEGSASILTKIPDSLNYCINKLSLNFITGSIEIRLRTNENSSGERFKLSMGVIGGYLLQSHIKYKDDNGKVKVYGIENLNKFQYGLNGRFGYRWIGASVYYSMVDVFEKDKGPELTPYSVGISFTF